MELASRVRSPRLRDPRRDGRHNRHSPGPTELNFRLLPGDTGQAGARRPLASDPVMASPPIERLIENPGTGERIRLLTRAEETGGRLLAFELHLEPGGRVPAPHRHPGQEERFQVLEGRLRFRVGLRARVLGPGDAITVPVGAPHGFSNPGPTPALVRVEVRPALRT